MAEKLCMGCMNTYHDSYCVCPTCGYIEGTAPKEAYHLSPGVVLQGKYIVGKVIGYGGFGVTYIGYNAILDQKVAIKEYLPGEFATRTTDSTEVTIFSGEREEQFAGGVVKFVEEAKRLAKFKHTPGIVGIYDSFQENKTAYIVMEYLEGETLSSKLDREGKLSLEDSINLMKPVLSALKEVHKEGILHRDISPDNIFITKDDEVKLLDFGAARYATSTTHSKSLSVIVKPGYAPQEQYRSRGDQGTWTDIYACAATLYKMITGVTPEDSMERGNKDTLVPPSKLGIKIPKNKENAIMNALNLKIEDRTKDAPSFEADLYTNRDVKRNKVKEKKMDVGRWPLWLKVSTGTAAAVIVAFAVLLVTGVISFGSINIFDKGGLKKGTVYVPNVVNYTLPEAEAKTLEAELITQIVDKQNSDAIPKDMVLSQNIRDGEIVDTGTVLELVISAGGELVYLPNLIGMTKEEAIKILEELGLYYEIKEEKSDIAPGCVCAQDVEEGTGIEKGDTINITISLGNEDYDPEENTIVPNLVGKTWDQATDAVQGAKLYMYKISSQYSESVPKGQIMSQDIGAGSEVKAGTTIGVVVSLGIKQTRVPDVQYKSKGEAEALLSQANLSIAIQYEESKTVAKDHVIRQSIVAGTEVDMQTTVTVWLSLGNPEAENAPKYEPTSTENTSNSNNNSNSSSQNSGGTSTSTPNADNSESSNQEEDVTQGTTTEAPIQEDPDEGNIEVPNVVGKTEAVAKSTLTSCGLTVGAVTYQHDETKADGTVISQGISSGTKVAKNSSINIVVCNNEQYTEYRYRTIEDYYTETSTTNSAPSGYTYWKEETVEVDNGWGPWSEWTATAVSASSTREVQTKEQQLLGRHHCGHLGGRYNKECSDMEVQLAWFDVIPLSFVKYIGDGEGYMVDYYGTGALDQQFYRSPSRGWDGRRVLYIYRDKNITYNTTYYFRKPIWSSWSSWSTTSVTATSEKEVETRKVYKY
ncbi:MAG: PASTA domain-containing protein [Lachnospiraceae bacterium]|nr:PASTA domain-containing protein [Lachnospiraceae bacterium]